MLIEFIKQPDLPRERRLARVGSPQLRLLPLFAAGFALYALEKAREFDFGLEGWLIGTPALLVAAFFVVYPSWVIRRNLRRNADLFSQPVAVTITDESVAFAASTSSGTIPWTTVTRTQEKRGFLFGRTPGRILFALPLECMTPDQVAELRAFVASRDLVKT